MTKRRYSVEWLNERKAIALMLSRGGSIDGSIWDHVDENEITEGRGFPTKALAFAWAKANADHDMYASPRVQEETHGPLFDDLGNAEGEGWEKTGYWEMQDGAAVEITT